MKYFLYILLSFMSIACSTTRKQSVQLPESPQTSGSFKTLWQDISSHTDNFSSIASYVPSDKIKDQYGISQKEGKFFINGFLHTDPSFQENEFKALGGESTTYADSIRTFIFPVNQITRLVKLRGIHYIELSRKANLRKPLNKKL